MRQNRAAAVAFCLIFAVLAVVSVNKLVFRAAHEMGDHYAYYLAAQRMMSGEDPYALTGGLCLYLYPPLWAMLVWPLTLAGPIAFAASWAYLLGCAWLALRRLTRALVPGFDGWRAVLADLMVIRFVLGAWSMGQVTLVLSALILAGLWLLQEGRGRWGGVLLGLAAAIKLYPALLAPAVARLGGRRALVTFLAAGVLFSLAPALVLGLAKLAFFVRYGFLGMAAYNIECQRWWSGRCAPLATAWHMLGGEAGSALSLAEAAWALALMLAVWLTYPRRDEDRPLWMGFAVLSMLIGTPMLGENYLALLLLPVAAMLARGGFAAPLALATVLLNVHSPLFVGRARSDPLERLGLSALGLMIMWGSMVWQGSKRFAPVAVAIALLCAATPAVAAVERHTYRDAGGEEHVYLLERPTSPAGLFIYVHGAGGFEEQGMNPTHYDGSFGRLRDLLARKRWAYACPREPDFESFLPRMKKQFPGCRIVLAGASAGGRRAYDELSERPDDYAGAILLCPAVGDPQAPVTVPCWIESGETDRRITGAARAIAALSRKAGTRVHYLEIPGGNHDAPVKKARWGEALEFLRP